MVTRTLCLVAESSGKECPSQKLTGKSSCGYSWLLSHPRECSPEGDPKSQEVQSSWQKEVASLSINQLIAIRSFAQLSLSQHLFRKCVFQKMDKGCGQKSPKRRSIAQTIRTLHIEDKMVCFTSMMPIHRYLQEIKASFRAEWMGGSWVRNCSCLFRQKKKVSSSDALDSLCKWMLHEKET